MILDKSTVVITENGSNAAIHIISTLVRGFLIKFCGKNMPNVWKKASNHLRYGDQPSKKIRDTTNSKNITKIDLMESFRMIFVKNDWVRFAFGTIITRHSLPCGYKYSDEKLRYLYSAENMYKSAYVELEILF